VFRLTARLQQICRDVKSRVSSRSNEDDIGSPDHKHGYGKIKNEEGATQPILSPALDIDEELIRSVPVDDFPRGFPRLAALLSADDDLMMFRGFRRIHSRVLLQMEVEITQLENALDKLDKEDDADPNMWYRLSNTEHDEDWDPRQKELFDQLLTKLKEYGEWYFK
jgi:hypothetical protein